MSSAPDEASRRGSENGSSGDEEGRIRQVARRLEEAHGNPAKTRREPLDELVHTILSQNTNDTNRDRAWKRLRQTFPDWESVLTAPREELEEAIRTAGLAGQKARAIHGVLETLHRERGELSLDHLEEMSDRDALEYLTGFRGVGVKTAACVLCFALRRPYMPVDTHVRRVSERLGLLPEGTGAGPAHRILNRTVPPELRFPLHLLLIRHGRATCSAREPSCGTCVLADLCPRIGVESDA